MLRLVKVAKRISFSNITLATNGYFKRKINTHNLWEKKEELPWKTKSLQFKNVYHLSQTHARKLLIYKNKKVFITGNSGFKGAWLSIFLKELGAKVIGYSDKIKWEKSVFDYNSINNIKTNLG